MQDDVDLHLDHDRYRYGVNHRKRTTIFASDAAMLSRLENRCNHRKKHDRLAGWVDRSQSPKKRKHKATKLAVAYSIKLCNQWASLVKQHLQQP